MKVRLVEVPTRERSKNPVLAVLRGSPEWLGKFRVRRGYTAQAIAVTSGKSSQACPQCGERGHNQLYCRAPVRRFWGFPGWEPEPDPTPPRLRRALKTRLKRSASLTTDSPSTTKQTLIASRACSFVRTTVNLAKSTPSKPKRPRTSKGMPAKPQ